MNEFYLDLLNTLIDDRIDMFGYNETIQYLLDRGCTFEQMVDDLQFDVDDVKEELKIWEENNLENI